MQNTAGCLATSAEEEVHIRKRTFLKIIGKYSHTPQSISAASIMDIETENWKILHFLPSTTSPFAWTTIYLWLLTEKQKASDLCLSDQGPRWELCCDMQWLQDVAFRWNNVTPAFGYTRVTQMSAGLDISCPLWAHSPCDFQPSSQISVGILESQIFDQVTLDCDFVLAMNSKER